MNSSLGLVGIDEGGNMPHRVKKGGKCFEGLIGSG